MYYAYILTDKNNRLFYTGVTNDVVRRTQEHITKFKLSGYCERYNINKLVYYEGFNNPSDAINAEKKIKKLSQPNKYALITSKNPHWADLFEGELI